MAWTEDIYPHFQPFDPHAFQILPAPQPTTVLQQLPGTVMPPSPAPSIRPVGHVKEGLVELMMIQNAQMHQVIMNYMTVSALRLSGCYSSSPGPEVLTDVVIMQENEADPQVYHHHYQPASYLSYPAWLPPQATADYQENSNISTCSPPQHGDRRHGDAYSCVLRPAVPPRRLPSATGTAAGKTTSEQQHPANSQLTRSAGDVTDAVATA